METIKKKTVKEILDYVVEYYRTNARGLDSMGYCKYITPEGNRCGHSICLRDDVIEEISLMTKQSFSLINSDNVISQFSDEVHKPEFRNYPKDFWREIQILHDANNHWENNELGGNNLTEHGLKHYNTILKIYSK